MCMKGALPIMNPLSKTLECTHPDAEAFSKRKLPESGARYYFRIWLDGTVVLWQDMDRPSWMPSRDVLISMCKNPNPNHETHHPSDRVLPHDHEHRP